MSEVYEWSVPSIGDHECFISVSLWLRHSQNTRKWDVASERLSDAVNEYIL